MCVGAEETRKILNLRCEDLLREMRLNGGKVDATRTVAHTYTIEGVCTKWYSTNYRAKLTEVAQGLAIMIVSNGQDENHYPQLGTNVQKCSQ